MSTSLKSNSRWTIVFIAIFFISPLKAIGAKEPLIRVLIGQENKARFRADGSKSIFVKGISSKQRPIKSINIIYSNGSANYSLNNNLNSWFELPKNFNLIIKNNHERGIWYKNRRYAGELRVSLNDNKLQIINYLKLEKYLKSVVGSEMPKEFPIAALQAQAIAARTYALKLLGKNQFFDIHSTQASQVYLGLEAETAKINRAVKSTSSLALFYKNELIEAVFHSSSGGRTENSGQVWKYQLPYLRSVVDYDQNSIKYRWTKEISSSELDQIFSGLGGLNSIQIIKKSNTDRVLKVRLYGPKGNENISGRTLRKKLKLLSNKFDLNLKFNQINQDDKMMKINYIYGKNKFNLDKKLDSDFAPYPLPVIPIDYFLLVKGYGAGHGVGMSQWGARAMAERGASFHKILKHYYTGVQIKTF
ncbi:SpoIID/LytB domain-containing protein [Prochlorococcus marinus]|uniref:SpoIID/LytB domain-containing protein n=1 Tax=Prochlorococcus marinus TaxID=1219 RepID=UPI0022B46FD5|nr:SpoIID/LytB domain-containing protein [Prochlorococcus marinus]